MLRDLYRLALSGAQSLYCTHFGVAAPAQQLIELVLGKLLMHMHIAAGYRGKKDARRQLNTALQEYTLKELCGCLGDKNVAADLVGNEMDLMLEPLYDSANGLLLFLQQSKFNITLSKNN